MIFAYNDDYHPPFPEINIQLTSPTGERSAVLPALLDTGADGTFVPMMMLRAINAPVFEEVRVRSHWGEWRIAYRYLVNVSMEEQTLRGIFVVGDETGNEIVIGRNVLNKLKMTYDGPAQQTHYHF